MTRTCIVLTVLFALNCLPAWATSASKSYKIFVNLPARVSIPKKDTESITQLSKAPSQEITEKIVTTAGNKKILLRTFVVK